MIVKKKIVTIIGLGLIGSSILSAFSFYLKDKFYVKTVSSQDSSLLNTLSEANCLVYIPKGSNSIAIGKEIEILALPLSKVLKENSLNLKNMAVFYSLQRNLNIKLIILFYSYFNLFYVWLFYKYLIINFFR